MKLKALISLLLIISMMVGMIGCTVDKPGVTPDPETSISIDPEVTDDPSDTTTDASTAVSGTETVPSETTTEATAGSSETSAEASAEPDDTPDDTSSSQNTDSAATSPSDPSVTEPTSSPDDDTTAETPAVTDPPVEPSDTTAPTPTTPSVTEPIVTPADTTRPKPTTPPVTEPPVEPSDTTAPTPTTPSVTEPPVEPSDTTVTTPTEPPVVEPPVEPSDTTATTPTEPPVVEPTDDRLIFFEDFEGQSISNDSNAVLAALGWVKDTTANGAYKNNTTSYSIVTKDGSKQLYLVNNTSSGTDSYLILLTSELMGFYHEQDYTYQYDVNYESSSDAKRYIALVSEYNGQFYNSFHLRNCGYANNQVHSFGEWLNYDVAGAYHAAATDGNAICNKLLGVAYSESAKPLQGLSISIRYQVDWDNGNKIYLRLNTAGYANTGKWILVSKAASSAGGASSFDPKAGGAAIVLKTGSKINGYVDNIVIWKGLGEEPTNKSSAILSSKDKGCSGHVYSGKGTCADPKICRYCGYISEASTPHNYVAVGGTGDRKCTICLGFESSISSGWMFPKLPAYAGGTPAKELYYAGHGFKDTSFTENDDSKMIVIAGTNTTQFSAYCDLLVSYGADEVYHYTCDGNIYYQYDLYGEAYIYTYFTASVNEVRIIYDNQSECSPEEFGYTYQKQAGDKTVLYQYGVPMVDGGPNDSKKKNHGMVYVVKLADNSLLVLDGGAYQYFDGGQVDRFMQFLRTITGTTDGQVIKIAGWYMSHAHGDHTAGFCLTIKKYHKNFDFDRIFFNFPTVNSDIEVFANSNTQRKIINYIDKYIRDDGVKYIKLHTGQSFNLADVKIDVIYTHEDIVNAKTGKSEIANDFNNSSSVIRLEIDGETFMFLGDINKPAMNVIIENNSAETLRSDSVQLAHHVFNDLRPLYDIIQAPVVLVPQSEYTSTNTSTRRAIMKTVKKYAKPDMIFYQNVATIGLEVQNGEFVKVYEDTNVPEVLYTGWSW